MVWVYLSHPHTQPVYKRVEFLKERMLVCAEIMYCKILKKGHRVYTVRTFRNVHNDWLIDRLIDETDLYDSYLIYMTMIKLSSYIKL